MHFSTALPRDLVEEFHNKPIRKRVVLPDGSHAVVTKVSEFGGPKAYKVQKCTPRGRFIPMHGAPSWYSEDELSLFYRSASINMAAVS